MAHHVTRSRAGAAVVCVAALGLAACGANDEPTPLRGTLAATPSPQTTATEAPAGTSVGPLEAVELTWPDGVDPGAAAGHVLEVPQGWTADVWANIPEARLAAWTPDGRLAVTAAKAGRVALVTPGAAGQAPTVSTLVDGLDNPQGIAFMEGDAGTVMVIGQEHEITAWDYNDATVVNPRTVRGDLPGGGHGAKGIAVQDGWIAYSLGSSSNRDPADRAAEPERAVVARVRLDGTGHEVIATGVRNGFGLAYAPDGSLYTAVNQADNQPYPFRDGTDQYGQVITEYVNENPVDQVTRVTDGVDLGWPYCIPDTRGSDDLTRLPYIADPELNPDQTHLDCEALEPIQLGLPAHSAPLGLAFTDETPLADVLGTGALIGTHGSWNRTPPRSPYVGFSPWNKDTGTLGPMEVLVTGFQSEDGSRWGRSVAAVPGPDGSLYVTDDAAGLVYRLTPP